MPDIEVTLLRDVAHGGAKTQPRRIASLLAEFVTSATTSLDVAIYDFRLDGPLGLAAPVVDAFKQAAARGVAIRIGYDAGKPAPQTTAAFAAAGGDPAPVGTEAWLHREFGQEPIELAAIAAPSGQLMHSKFVVRDAHTAQASVWMGSANFTEAAWTRQENNIVRLRSAALAAAYETDFEELWRTKKIESTGAGDTGTTSIEGTGVSWAFSPGEGPAIDARLALAISAARRRLRISSMVLTSHTVLGALADAIEAGKDVAGVYDGGEMKGVEKMWGRYPSGKAALETWRFVKTKLTAKPSAGYTKTGPHDFMHNKVLVSDDRVLTGSYNFSANAEGNAENQLSFESPALAGGYARYIGALVKQYAQ